MKTIIKKAKHLAVILGITERAVTYRVKSIRRKELVLKKKAQKGDISFAKVEKTLNNLIDDKLAGYIYQVDNDGEKPQYTFYKNT